MKKKIKIIDLLISYANGEKQPRKIKFRNKEYTYNGNAVLQQLLDENNEYFVCILNDEVEILDEEDEFEDIESFGVHYSWDYIFDTLDKLIKNQKKIIERLKDGE